MYETKQETAGLRGGFRQSKPPRRVECVPASVLYEGQRSRAYLHEKGARARRQTRTGGVKTFQGNDASILAGKPKPVQWLATILLALTMCGVLPMAAAEGLIWFTDTYNCYWLVLVLAAGVVWFIYRLIERDL